MDQQNVAGGGQPQDQGEGQAQDAEGINNPFGGWAAGEEDDEGGGEEEGGVNRPIQSRPYCFRKCRDPPTTLYMLSMKVVLRRYLYTEETVKKPLNYPSLRNKSSKRQMERYLSVLPSHLKSDILTNLFSGGNWYSYRQAQKTMLDRQMFDNNLCCTYPEECPGLHESSFRVNKEDLVAIWRILQGTQSTTLDLLPFMENYNESYLWEDNMFNLSTTTRDIFRNNQLRAIESSLTQSQKILANIQKVLLIGTFRELNAPLWAKLLPTMLYLQSIELHFWAAEHFFKIIHDLDVELKELILCRQRKSMLTKDIDLIPKIITKFKSSLRIFILDSKDQPFTEKLSKDIQRAISKCENLECLKIESCESPYLHWCNSRYRIKTKKLIMSLRRSDNYRTVIRNINRCFNSDVNIDLFYDTYVDIDNHKHSFFSNHSVLGGGENTVSISTRTFEALELHGDFYKLMSEFGVKVKRLSAETDIRPEYFMYQFPNLEYLELFARASRKVPVDTRFIERPWRNLKDFAMEVDPGFSSLTVEGLLIHVLGDIFTYTNQLETLKIHSNQSGIKVSETSLLVKLNQVRSHMNHLKSIEFLSPFCMSNSGLTSKLADFFLSSCPNLEILRDVASWAGSEEGWANVALKAERLGLNTAWANKTSRSALYTIDFDSEGWVQADTGHQFELYNNFNDDWDIEVDNDEMEEFGIDILP